MQSVGHQQLGPVQGAWGMATIQVFSQMYGFGSLHLTL